MDLTGQTLVAVLPDAGPAGRMAGFTRLPRLLVEALGASVHAGAICTHKRTQSEGIRQTKSPPPQKTKNKDQGGLTEQEVSLVAAQAVSLARA